MGEGDVVSTEIVTLIASFLVVLGHLLDGRVSERLPCGLVGITDIEAQPLGLVTLDGLASAGAVGTDLVECLDFRVDVWPSSGVDGDLVTTEIVVSEVSLLLRLLLLGELGVHKEDW